MTPKEFVTAYNVAAAQMGFGHILRLSGEEPDDASAVAVDGGPIGFTLLLKDGAIHTCSMYDTAKGQNGRALVAAALTIDVITGIPPEERKKALRRLGLLDKRFLNGMDTHVGQHHTAKVRIIKNMFFVFQLIQKD